MPFAMSHKMLALQNSMETLRIYIIFTVMGQGKIGQGKNGLTSESLCAIWYHLCNFKNVKNTHGGVILSVQLLAEF